MSKTVVGRPVLRTPEEKAIVKCKEILRAAREAGLSLADLPAWLETDGEEDTVYRWRVEWLPHARLETVAPVRVSVRLLSVTARV